MANDPYLLYGMDNNNADYYSSITMTTREKGVQS